VRGWGNFASKIVRGGGLARGRDSCHVHVSVCVHAHVSMNTDTDGRVVANLFERVEANYFLQVYFVIILKRIEANILS
jgi:hypothetical protein